MFFGCGTFLYLYCYMSKLFRRKETLSPNHIKNRNIFPPKINICCKRRAFFFDPLSASMTVEASAALPIFFICMAALLQLGNVMSTAVRFGNALCETGEQMAVGAYASEYGEGNSILTTGLSAVYAGGSVMGKAGKTDGVKNVNFLLSSFLKEEDMIHLVMTYQIEAPVGGVKIPGIFFLQRGSVRGWTGRKGSGGGKKEDSEEGRGEAVFVTEHGSVYHRDLECSHIKLSIQRVTKGSLENLRSSDGGKYYACEKCGKNAGNDVYITMDGDRYHSSLECSGLKRSVHEVSLEELGALKPCSRCG